MNNDRAADFAGQADLLAKSAFLYIAGTAIAVVVEAYFSDGHHLGALTRQCFQIVQGGSVEFGRIVGMDSYGGIYGGMLLGQFYACPGTAQIAADGDHVGDARLKGPIDDLLAIIVISAAVEMGMGVDECRL
jgi:hypothetical protein